MNVNFIIWLLTFLGAFVFSLFLTKVVIGLARRWQIMDYPRAERKIHHQPTPLLGGLAIYLAWLFIIAVLYFSGQLFDDRITVSTVIFFLSAGLILIINGILDDKYNLPAAITIWGPILASVLVISGGLTISHITHPAGGILYLDKIFTDTYAILPTIITFLWLMSITYTTKLLDGIDGLTAGLGSVASLVIFIVSLSWDVAGSTTALLSLSLAGAVLGFLCLNWHPAKIFLGEGGSTLIGFSLGVLSIISGSKIATALLVMGLPLLDIFWVLVRRLKRGQPFWQGDKEHLHFRLLAAGLKQRQIVLFFIIVSLSFGLVSIFFTTKAKIGALILMLFLMFILSTALNYRLKNHHEES